VPCSGAPEIHTGPRITIKDHCMNRKSPVPLWAVLSVGIVLVGGIYFLAQRSVTPPEASLIVRQISVLPSPSTTPLPALASPMLVTSPSSSPAVTAEPIPSDWKTYKDPDYHFTFSYPSELALRQSTPPNSDYGAKSLSLYQASTLKTIVFYVTTPTSIYAWNSSLDMSHCPAGQECDQPFEYLDCEATSTRCSEDSQSGIYNSERLQRRAVIKKEDLRVEMSYEAILPYSNGADEATLQEADQHLFDLFDQIFSTLKFVATATPVSVNAAH
jgi:hypothetical protein